MACKFVAKIVCLVKKKRKVVLFSISLTFSMIGVYKNFGTSLTSAEHETNQITVSFTVFEVLHLMILMKWRTELTKNA